MTLDQLSNLSRIDDILAFFGIADTAGVVEEHGTTVLRLWANAVAALDELRPLPPEPERLRCYAAALRGAYEAVARPARHGARGWYVIEGGARGDPSRRAS